MKEELINELSRLYRLRQEGIKVESLIRELEEKLWKECDKALDSEKTNAKNKKNGKEVKVE